MKNNYIKHKFLPFLKLNLRYTLQICLTDLLQWLLALMIMTFYIACRSPKGLFIKKISTGSNPLLHLFLVERKYVKVW